MSSLDWRSALSILVGEDLQQNVEALINLLGLVEDFLPTEAPIEEWIGLFH